MSVYVRLNLTQSEDNVIKIFLENDGKISDEQLANLLAIANIESSSSTVGRDLTGKVAKTILTEEEYNQIILLRKQNLLAGKQKGGQNYALNNNFTKDENNKFTGSVKR